MKEKLIAKKNGITILTTIVQHSPIRYRSLEMEHPDVSPRALSGLLCAAHAEGLVTRKVTTGFPPQVHYSITALGRKVFEWVNKYPTK